MRRGARSPTICSMPNVGKLRYLEAPSQGERPRGALVLLHAFPLNARMWEPQLVLAATGGASIAPHLRGFDGGTGDPPASTVDDYAGDVIDLLDALHIDDAVICRPVDGRLRGVCDAAPRAALRSRRLFSRTRDRRPTRRRASRRGSACCSCSQTEGPGGRCRRDDPQAPRRVHSSEPA